MKTLFAVFVILVLATPVFAQEAPEQAPPAATKGHNMADAAMPSEILFTDFPTCVEKLVAAGLEPKNAVKACQKARDVEAKRATEASKQAAKAAKAAQPRDPCGNWFLAPSYCYGYGGHSRGYVVQRPYYLPRGHQPARQVPQGGGGHVTPYQPPR
jgi:hypothetical protein